MDCSAAAVGYYGILNIRVNEEILPELDEAEAVSMNPFRTSEDGYGEADFCNYDLLQEELGLDLLDTELASDNPYLLGHIITDNTDLCTVTLENYITGDTSGYEYLPEILLLLN